MTDTTTDSEHLGVLTGGPSIDEREARLTEAADNLADKQVRPSILGHPRFLLAVAATLMTIGLSTILLGYYGAARSTHVEEQVPYLISGGLFGLALSVVGALTLFTHWLTVMIRESRASEAARQVSHQELLAAMRSLIDVLGRQEESDGTARGGASQRPVRRSPRGS